MRALVTGASGFAGSALLGALLREGHQCRALARDRVRLARALSTLQNRALAQEVEVALGDVLTGAGLTEALHDVEVAYYLIHSMEPATGQPAPQRERRAAEPFARRERRAAEPFPQRERRAAENFARAARRAGVRRIVYLGGLLPPSGPASQHLASRHAVERILMEAAPESVALRASIVVGARSRSFRFLVRLVERLPVIALPAWRRYRTQPIDERDLVQMLIQAGLSGTAAGRTLEVGGPDVLSYQEIVERIAELMMVGRPTIGLAITATPLAARLAAVLTQETPELVLPLMEGLTCDLLPRGEDAARLMDVTLHSFDAAVEHALGDWERLQPLAAR